MAFDLGRKKESLQNPNDAYKDAKEESVKETISPADPVRGAKSDKEAMESMPIADLPSHLTVPRSFYELPKTAFHEAFLAPETARFAITDPRDVRKFRSSFMTERVGELRPLAKEKLIADHFVNIGYGELESIEDMPGISNGEVLMRNYEAFAHNPEAVRENIAEAIWNKYSFHLKKAEGKAFQWGENEIGELQKNPEQFRQKLREAVEYVRTHVNEEEGRMYSHILAMVDRAQREVEENNRKRYRPIIDDTKEFYDNIVKNALKISDTDDLKLGALMDALSIPERRGIAYGNVAEELQKLLNLEGDENKRAEILADMERLEELKRKIPDLDLDASAMAYLKKEIEKAAAAPYDVTLSSQLVSAVLQTAFQNTEANPIDLLDGIANDHPEVIDETKEFKANLEKALEEAFRDEHIAKEFPNADPKRMAKSIFETIRYETKKNETVRKKLFGEGDLTAECNPFLDTYNHANVEIAVNAMKDAALFAVLKEKNPYLAGFLNERGTLQKILSKEVDMSLSDNRPVRLVNDVMNVHNMLFRINKGNLGAKEIELLADSPIFKNSSVIKPDMLETFKRSMRDMAERRIDYSTDVYGKKLEQSDVQRNVAEHHYLSLFNVVAGKNFASRLANDLATGGGVRRLQDCLRKGSVQLTRYHTPSENYANCFKEFVSEGQKIAEDQFQKMLHSSSQAVNIFNPFLALAFFDKLWTKAKAEQLEYEWSSVLNRVVNDAYYINSAFGTKEQQARLAVFNAVNGTKEEGHYHQLVVKRGHELDFEREVNEEAIIYSISSQADLRDGFTLPSAIASKLRLDGEKSKIAERLASLEERLKDLKSKTGDLSETAERRKALAKEIGDLEKEIADWKRRMDEGETGAALHYYATEVKLNRLKGEAEELDKLLSDDGAQKAMLEEAERVEKEIEELRQSADGFVLAAAASKGGIVRYDDLDLEAKKAMLDLYHDRQNELSERLLNNPLDKAAKKEFEENQKIISRLHKELLKSEEIVGNMDYVFGESEEAKLLFQRDAEIRRKLEKFVEKNDFTGAKNAVRESSIDPYLKGVLLRDLDYAEGLPKVVEQMSRGEFINTPVLKKHFEKLRESHPSLYESLVKTNGITAVVKDDIGAKEGVEVEIHQGVNSFVYNNLAELERTNPEAYNAYVQRLERYEERDEYLKEAALSRRTVRSILDRADLRTANQTVSTMRRDYNRVSRLKL